MSSSPDNGVCKDCVSDSECAEKSPFQSWSEMSRTYCFEYTPKCIKGMCYTERSICSGYVIQGGKCVSS